MHYKATARPLGLFLLVLAGSMLLPLIFALFEDQQSFSTQMGFLTAIGATGVVSLVLLLAGRGNQLGLHRKEGLFIVAAGWTLAGLLGSIPYMVSGVLPDFFNALLETISGFTTTGATTMPDIEIMPRSILFWRALTTWLGGVGIVVLFVAVLPSLGIGGKHLYRSETSGPSKSGLTPRTADTAKYLWLIYLGLTAVLIALLCAAGMPVFDSVCHAFATVSNAGYGTQNDSMASYSSVVHVIMTVFMLACGVNFALYYSLIRNRLSPLRDGEFRFYLFIFMLAVTGILIKLQLSHGGNVWINLRDSSFTVASMMTSAGFATADFEKWPQLATGIIVALTLFGGCAGSTSGGIKQIRVLVALRTIWMSIIRSFRPQAIMSLRVGGEPMDDQIEHQIVTFVLLYLLWAVLGILIMFGCGYDFTTSITAVFSSIGNTGPGLGLVGPMDNYSALHPVAKITLTLLMLVGRLELMAISVLFVPSFWHR